MWEFMCQQSIYRRIYKTASQPTGLDSIVVVNDGYYASEMLRYCNKVNLIINDKIKQMKAK